MQTPWILNSISTDCLDAWTGPGQYHMCLDGVQGAEIDIAEGEPIPSVDRLFLEVLAVYIREIEGRAKHTHPESFKALGRMTIKEYVSHGGDE